MATLVNGSSGDLALDILAALNTAGTGTISSSHFPNVAFSDMKAAVDRLSSRSMVSYKQVDQEIPILEPEGELIADHGSHEARVFEAVRQALEGLTIAELEKTIGDASVTKLGQGKAFREKWISKGKDGKLVASVRSPFRLPSYLLP
jgi:phenylalanyl-tRNA synthetase alpha chain